MKKFLHNFPFLLILCSISIAIYFFNLNWGAPFYFHPDERNIASSVQQLKFPTQMNPQFFAYGSLPIYAIYFVGLTSHFLTQTSSATTVSFEQAIIISRFFSAIFATALIPLIFFITRSIAPKQTSKQVGLLAAFLATTSVGFLQFSHFGTFEMWITFFSLLLFWICLQKITYQTIIFMGIIFGVLVATKISSIVLIALPLFTITYNSLISQKITVTKILQSGAKIILFLTISFIIYFATNPFVILDFLSFKNSIEYESSLALGTLPVFYTGEFFSTLPIIFQFTKIYPFLLNPLITILFLPAFLYLSWKAIKIKQFNLILLISSFLILFLSQAFLFAKWTRYMIPTLPFIYLIVATALSSVIARSIATKQSHQTRLPRVFQTLAMTVIIFACSLFAVSYFITAFVKGDTRIEALRFAQKTIPKNASILSEVYDLGIVPFNSNFSNITLFNFYDLDNNSQDWTEKKLKTQLESTDYIIVPSQRLLKTRLLNRLQFPKGYMFYGYRLDQRNPLTLIGSPKPHYKQIYETPCDIFCKITYLGDPVFRYEQTANVFDRPTVMIFKKM